MSLKEFDNYYDAIDAGYGGKAVRIGGKDVIASKADRYLGDGKYGSTKGRDEYVSSMPSQIRTPDDTARMQSQWAMSNPIAQSDYYRGSGIKSQAKPQNFWDEWNLGTLAKGAITMMNPALGIPMMLSSGIKTLFSDKDGDGSRWTSTAEDGTVTNILGQKLNMDDGRKISGFFDSFDVDGDGSMFTSGGKFFTPQTPDQQKAYLDHARATGGGGDSSPAVQTITDPNQVGTLPDGTPQCAEGYYYDTEKKMCVEVPTTQPVTPVNTNQLASNVDFLNYDSGGEQILSQNVVGAKHGMALPMPPTGIVQGRGGPKDDMVGPLALSAGEFVMPIEQIIDEGNGDYNRGIASLENNRLASLQRRMT
mgnify:CR=1 FL=1